VTGSLPLIKDDISSVLRDHLSLKDQDVESVWVEIRNSKGMRSLVGIVNGPLTVVTL